MTELITSKNACNILKVTRPELHILVKFEVLKPKRIHVNKFLYNLKEVKELLIAKNRVQVSKGLCTK